MTTDHVVMRVDEVHQLALNVLLHAGLSLAQAEPVAQVIAAGERDECHAHGLYRLPGCVETVQSPIFDAAAEPVVSDITPAFTRVDARYGYSLLAFERALPLVESKARALGISLLAINNCFHFSALWPEVEQLTERGLAVLIVTPSHGWVTPEGGTQPVLGTNPIAFGWPRRNQPPYVFDFATSAIARGEIAIHKLANKPIPLGWGVDSSGQPSTDAAAVLQGAMLTFGGHKGSALSTMIELLAGPMIGDLTSMESMAFDAGHKAAPCHGEFIVVFDPRLLGGTDSDANDARAEALFAAFTNQGARLPSQRRYQARERSVRDGVRVPRHLYERALSLLPPSADTASDPA